MEDSPVALAVVMVSAAAAVVTVDVVTVDVATVDAVAVDVDGKCFSQCLLASCCGVEPSKEKQMLLIAADRVLHLVLFTARTRRRRGCPPPSSAVSYSRCAAAHDSAIKQGSSIP